MDIQAKDEFEDDRSESLHTNDTDSDMEADTQASWNSSEWCRESPVTRRTRPMLDSPLHSSNTDYDDFLFDFKDKPQVRQYPAMEHVLD